MTYLLLALIVLIGFTTEAAIGFGATIISLTLAANLLPIEQFLPIFVPVNYGLFLYIALRHKSSIEKTLLIKRILPTMGLGMPIGLLVFNLAKGESLNYVYSVFVIALAALVLIQMIRNPKGMPVPLSPSYRNPLLFFSGIMHGMYSTGGPMVVYYLAREPINKTVFRSTCCVVWLMMGTVLIINFAATGLITKESLGKSVFLVIPLFCGIALGEWLNDKVNERYFRFAVFGALLMAGMILLVNTAF